MYDVWDPFEEAKNNNNDLPFYIINYIPMTTKLKELQKLEVYNTKDIVEAIEKSSMEINDAQDAQQSEIVKNMLKNHRLSIEKTRKDLVQPYNDIVKQINTKAKELIEPIQLAEKWLNKKQIAYNDLVEEEKRKQQEEMNQLAKETGWHEEAEVENETIEREAERQKVQRGINYNKKIVKVDRDVLPRKYWNIKDMEITPNQMDIKKDMKEWIRIDWITFEY